MVTSTKNKIKGNDYYYYVESRRVNGKPRIINQVYLGTAERVLKDTQGGQRPKKARHQSFGDVATLDEISEQLGIIEAINSTVGKRVAGLSVGQYFLIAAINRACLPVRCTQTGKNDIVNWYKRTAPELIALRADFLYWSK